MRDTRINVRLSVEQHEKLKILVIKKKTTINKFILDYIEKEIKKDEVNEKTD